LLVTTSLTLLSGVAFAFALVLAPLAGLLAMRIGAVDHPGERRVHMVATPRLGGPAILGAMVLALFIISLFDREDCAMVFAQGRNLSALVVGAFIVMIVGAIDDVRSQKPLTKLMVEFCAAAIVVSGGWSFHFGVAWFPLSVFFIVASTNAINLVDGLDGLAAGLSLMIGVTLILLSHGRTPPLMLFALCGALIGFLPYNLHPAKVFLGDSGALLAGFLLGAGAISTSHVSGALAPVIALGLPLLELGVTTARRMLRALPLFGADRDHIHHRMLGFGISHQMSVLLLYVCGAAFCASALIFARVDDTVRISLLATLIVGSSSAVRMLGYHREPAPIAAHFKSTHRNLDSTALRTR
jgi:UDP-GlcNAc:undecaprenyl-phosphate/decaprenyl-phosphate GlcNAc-1-phosphate transferase